MPRHDQLPPAVVAVLGLGEAGSLIARDLLLAGAVVRGYDPAHGPDLLRQRVPGLIAVESEAAACDGADLVLSLTSAAEAEIALRNGLAAGTPGLLWADLNTASPGLKAGLAEIAGAAGCDLVDVALLSPVPGKGLATPAIASGALAATVAAALNQLGGSVEVVAGPPGAAATRKLLRSVFFKGLAAAVVEAMAAGEAAGLGDWLGENIASQLVEFDRDAVERLLSGSQVHAVRRMHEMQAAAEMVAELGVDPVVTRATVAVLAGLAANLGADKSACAR